MNENALFRRLAIATVLFAAIQVAAPLWRQPSVFAATPPLYKVVQVNMAWEQASIQETLDRLAAEGWELAAPVSQATDAGTRLFLIFKK